MARYIVTGGIPLKGEVSLSGAKNSGFKLMIAALLADSPSQIENIGLTSEIDLAKDNIKSLGGSVSDCGDHCVKVDPSGLSKFEISRENGEKSRSCTYYIPILLHKLGQAIVPLPGGDKIATRPLERHFDGLSAMGAKIINESGVIKAKVNTGKLNGTKYHFAKNTHGGTDTLILAAVLVQGQTILENCAQDPEIDNLIEFLNLMGGKIVRDQRTITIEGVDKLHGATIRTIPDRNEAVTFGCAALGTRGEVKIHGSNYGDLESYIAKVREAGGGYEVDNDLIKFWGVESLKATDVTTDPCPGFMTDWQPLWTTLMTQAHGNSFVHETIHESRFGFVPALVKMGAKIELFRPQVPNPDEVYNFNIADDKPENPHAAKIFGPTPLVGKEVEIKDIRAGATLMLAGLIASGQTIINDPLDQIKRGYEDLAGKLIKLGAKIEVVD